MNVDLGVLAKDKGAAIMQAADEVIAASTTSSSRSSCGRPAAARSTNMNMNEVLANRASEILGGERGEGRKIHPNDDVNRGQSSNDVFPTAMHVAAVHALESQLRPALRLLRETLARKQEEFADIVKIGRTHLQDATPLTLGQEFSGYVAMLDLGLRHIDAVRPGLCELALGGTAVGTGLNAHPEFAVRVAAELASLTGYAFVTAPKSRVAVLARRAVVRHGRSGGGGELHDDRHDVRGGLGSAQRLGELSIPRTSRQLDHARQGQPDAERGAHHARLPGHGQRSGVNMARRRGNFELNVFKPLIIHNFLHSVRLLADGAVSFMTLRDGDHREPRAHRRSAAAVIDAVTALNPHIGYDKAAKSAKNAPQGLTLKGRRWSSGT